MLIYLNIFVVFIVFYNYKVISQSQCFTPLTGTTLTFYSNALTTSARSSPIDQLNCYGGNGCKYSDEVQTVQCTCTGVDDYGKAQWNCISELPTDLSLGQVTVSCEGCHSSTDTEMLVGSCGLYYMLNYNTPSNVVISNNEYENRIFYAIKIFFIMCFSIFCCAMCVIGFKLCYDNYKNNARGYESLPLRHDSFPPVKEVQLKEKKQKLFSNSTNTAFTQSIPVPSAPPVALAVPTNTYQQPVQQYQRQYVQPVQRSNQESNQFVNGLLVGEMMGKNHHNNVAGDILLMNTVGGGNQSFTNGVLMGEMMSQPHHKHNKHVNFQQTTYTPVQSAHHAKTSSHNSSGSTGSMHTSVGFGGSITR